MKKNSNVIHLFIYIGLLALVSCGPKQQAKDTIKKFVKENIGSVTQGDAANAHDELLSYSFKDFGKLDSTRYVTDSIIHAMQQRAEYDRNFESVLTFGKRTGKEQLKYIPVKMKIAEKDTTYTFYLTNDLESVVAFK